MPNKLTDVTNDIFELTVRKDSFVTHFIILHVPVS